MISSTSAEVNAVETAVSAPVSSLKIAYTIQNVGLKLTKRVGDVVPVRNTLDGLKKNGHEVHVFELGSRSITKVLDVGQIDQKVPTPITITGKRPFLLAESAVRRLQYTLNLPYFAFIDSWRFYDGLSQTIDSYDLCHEHNGLFSPATAWACKNQNKPYVLTFSADPILEAEYVNKPLKGIHKTIAARQAAFTYAEADQILCVSEPAKQHLVETWQVNPDKINVMPNGVDIELFGQTFDPKPIRAHWDLGNGPVISFVGGFQKWHGLENLVDSFVEIQKVYPQARLFLVGDGPYRTELDHKVKASGVQEKIVITGFVPQEQVPQLLSVADITVLPYPQLPKDLWFSPLKMYEYMAAGKAVVASSAGQIAEVIEDGETGLLVKPGDVSALTDALIELLAHPDKREQLAENGRLQAIRNHSWTHYIRKLEQIYEKAVQGRRTKT
ncbi:MAG: glycosyltransferase family 4 protein [Chloroflexota bacterium]